jgi:hypothetical protein
MQVDLQHGVAGRGQRACLQGGHAPRLVEFLGKGMHVDHRPLQL